MRKRAWLERYEEQIVDLIREGQGARTIAHSLPLEVSPTTVRKFIQDRDLRSQATNPHPIGAVSETELLREQLKHARQALNKNRRGDVARERILAAIEEALRDVPPPVHQTPIRTKDITPEAHHRQLVCWSDFHGGEIVNSEAVNGLNDYGWDIMEERFEAVLAGMLSHKRYSPELTGIDIMVIGDMCSGVNHEELARSNELPLAEQGVRIGYLIGSAIERLSQHYADIRVVQVVGNHPRLVKAPAAKDAHDNMDWVAGEIAKGYLRANDVVSSYVNVGPSAIHKIAGLTAYVFHGDGIRSSMPGVPWGGVMRRVNEIQRMRPTNIDLYYLGHFHDPNVVQGGRINMNGSLKGVDEWVLKNFGGGSPPTQLLQTFDETAERMVDTKWLTPRAGLPVW